MSGCPNSPPIVLECLKHDTEGHYFLVPRCKSWSCPYCGPINSRNLGRLAAEAIQSFIDENGISLPKQRYNAKSGTLTCPGDEWRALHSPAEARALHALARKRLLEWLRKQYDLEEYFWVQEEKNGYPHTHLLMLGTGISGKGIMRAINDKWECLGMGRSEVRLVKSLRGFCFYMAKYMSKAESKVASDGAHLWGMSKKLRSRVKHEKKVASLQFQVVRAFRRNSDGTRGKVIWEQGETRSISECLVESNLEALCSFFLDRENGKGEQLTFWDDAY